MATKMCRNKLNCPYAHNINDLDKIYKPKSIIIDEISLGDILSTKLIDRIIIKKSN
jgi:hypothetical protein